MTVIATSNPFFSTLFKGVDHYDFENMVNTHYETISVTGSGDIKPFGIPVIWNNATSTFDVYAAQDIAAVISTGGSPLAGGQVVGILVGSDAGKGVGYNKTHTLSGTGQNLTALYNGQYTLSDEGMTWGAANAGAQTAFKAELAKYDIGFIVDAADVDATYTV